MKYSNAYYTINNAQLMYRDFILGSKENKKRVPYQTLHTQILFVLFRKIIYYMFYHSYVFVFGRLGKFQLVKYMPEIKLDDAGKIKTNKILNVKETIKLKRETGNSELRVFYENEATGGYIYKVFWHRHYHFVNKYFYKFSLSRPVRQILKKAIIEDKIVAKVVDFKL